MNTPNQPMPLPTVATQFLEQLLTQRHLSPLTAKRYAHALGVFHAIHADIKQVSAAQLQRCIGQQHMAGLVPASLGVMVSAWRSYCKWALLQGHLSQDPAVDLLVPKRGKPLPKALAADLMQGYLKPMTSVSDSHTKPVTAEQQLLVAALNARDQAVLELLYGCGLRAAELLGLDKAKTSASVGWLDLSAHTVHVLGKGNKPRRVPLPSLASEAVQAWLALRDGLLKTMPLAHSEAPEMALFLSARGVRMNGSTLRKITQQRALASGLGQGVHPHMLRHSYASHLLQSSGDLRGVQELLGHASIAATQVYARLDFQHLAKVYDLAHPRAKVIRPKTS